MRNLLLSGLIVVNLILIVAVAGSVFHLPQAKAQVMGLAGNFMMVSGSVTGFPNDVVYIVNLETRQLSALTYDRDLSQIGARDLNRDLSVPAGMPRPGAERPRRTR